ncbi:integrase, catalytic region, zinc finger, CCHC-type containing protein [Tanacetum coccineum]
MFDESLIPRLMFDYMAPEVILLFLKQLLPGYAVSTGSPSSIQLIKMHQHQSRLSYITRTKIPIISHDVEEDNHDIEVAHRVLSTDQFTHDYNFLYGTSLICYYEAFLTSVEPKNYKDALTQACWIEAMQEELHEFERLEVWELVPPPDKVFVISLKWIDKRRLRNFYWYKIYVDDLSLLHSTSELLDTPMVEKSKLDEDKDGKAVDPSHYRGSAYRKALKCGKKDLSVSKRNRSSRSLVSEGFFLFTNSICRCGSLYYAIASGKIPPKTKGSKKKADTDATTKQKPPTVPKEKKEKKSGKGKQKAKELETISEANLTEAEQLKILTKRSRKETHISHASGSGVDEGTGITPGVPDGLGLMTQLMISPWRIK